MNTTKTSQPAIQAAAKHTRNGLTLSAIRELHTGFFFSNVAGMRRRGDRVHLLATTYTGRNCTYFLTDEAVKIDRFHSLKSVKVWEYSHETHQISTTPATDHSEPVASYGDTKAARAAAAHFADLNARDGMTATRRRMEEK